MHMCGCVVCVCRVGSVCVITDEASTVRLLREPFLPLGHLCPGLSQGLVLMGDAGCVFQEPLEQDSPPPGCWH